MPRARKKSNGNGNGNGAPIQPMSKKMMKYMIFFSQYLLIKKLKWWKLVILIMEGVIFTVLP